MDTRTSFTQTHLENKLMLNELGFFREEIGILERHLDELYERNTSMQVSDQVDEYRKNFARSRDMINGMENELVSAEKKMAIYAKSHETANFDEVNVADHAAFRQQFEAFKASYLKTKEEFRRFESEWA